MKNYVPDTSIIVRKSVTKLLDEKKIGGKIMISNAVLAEIEHQANQGLEIGFIGLEELQEIRNRAEKGEIELEFMGQRPTPEQIKYAKTGGEIDAIIKDLALKQKAVLITGDKVQAESARIFNIEVIFIEQEELKEKIEIEDFFDETTMSIHLKENCHPTAKKGTPGNWKLQRISDKLLAQEQVQEYAKEAVEMARTDSQSFVEISRRGSTIVQYRDIRIIITKPPVSDGWEITAVKPIKKLFLEEYSLDKILLERIKNKARGILIAGEVGSGKSTMAQAIAEEYVNQGKITKTVESPRDLQVSDQITQYSKNFTSSEEIHDILFLSRPDNIIFDEIRDTPDFRLFTDLRLAGSNCLGVLHAAEPIDSIQRFIGRLETGVIPHVIDTVLFMKSGKVEKVLNLKMVVKVPAGMIEADLARPVVVISDFKTGKPEYELYSYGEETVIVPITPQQEATPSKILASKYIEKELLKHVSQVNVNIASDHRAEIFVPRDEIAQLIGKQGKNIEQIENNLGIHIDVQELIKEKKPVKYSIKETSKFLMFKVHPQYSSQEVEIYTDSHFLFATKVGKAGDIKIQKKSKIGKSLVEDLNQARNVEIVV